MHVEDTHDAKAVTDFLWERNMEGVVARPRNIYQRYMRWFHSDGRWDQTSLLRLDIVTAALALTRMKLGALRSTSSDS